MIVVATPEGRIAYGPIGAGDIEPLMDARVLDGRAPKLRLGLPEELPFLKRQTRLTFARCAITDPLSIEDSRAHGGFRGLKRAISLAPAAIVEDAVQSGLRGHGGAEKSRRIAPIAAAE